MPDNTKYIGGGYYVSTLCGGVFIQNRASQTVYFKPGEQAKAISETIAALDEISENPEDIKRGRVADIALAEYFS
jgi:hypothetical protein